MMSNKAAIIILLGLLILSVSIVVTGYCIATHQQRYASLGNGLTILDTFTGALYHPDAPSKDIAAWRIFRGPIDIEGTRSSQ